MNFEGAGRDVSVEQWDQSWAAGRTGFHKSEVHGTLLKHFSKLVDGRSDLNVFLPLCGKTLDLKWIADQGHRAVGVEFSELACRSFFSEQKVEYTSTPMEDVPNGMVHTSKDGKIKLFQCDFYLFTEEHAGKYDIIWDRASLVAVNISDRTKYAEKVISLLKPDGAYLLNTFDYNQDAFSGPPHSVPFKIIQSLYEKSCNIELLEDNDVTAGWKRMGVKYFHEIVSLLKQK
ncbi:probable thiopurine S-methyltransferase isoform X2 [Ptychodera flava]